MKKRIQLLLEQSRLRETVIRLNKLEELTDEQRSELNTAVDRLENIEPEIRAATTAEAAETAEAGRTGSDPETRERNDLARRSRVGVFLRSMLSGRRPDGPEAELNAALGFGDGDIPMAVFDVPHADAQAHERAVTPAAATVGVKMAPIQPYVFASSIAGSLGIEIRDVPSGTYAIPRISTAPSSAAPKAKGVDADATAGALTVISATPKRIPARLSLALEDVAAFGNDTFETALRQALQSKLSDALDDQIVNGSGVAPNLSGLIKQLAAATAPVANVETFDRWAAIASSVVDGLWAPSLTDVSMVWNAAAFRQAAGVFRGTDGPVSAATYLADKTSGFRASSRMPAVANKIATGIAARLGQPGITRAVVPSWGRLVVDDIYTDSDAGQRHITISAIVGDLLIAQPSAYVKLAARVVA